MLPTQQAMKRSVCPVTSRRLKSNGTSNSLSPDRTVRRFDLGYGNLSSNSKTAVCPFMEAACSGDLV
jgi:hypothetical protein